MWLSRDTLLHVIKFQAKVWERYRARFPFVLTLVCCIYDYHSHSWLLHIACLCCLMTPGLLDNDKGVNEQPWLKRSALPEYSCFKLYYVLPHLFFNKLHIQCSHSCVHLIHVCIFTKITEVNLSAFVYIYCSIKTSLQYGTNLVKFHIGETSSWNSL